MNPVAWLAERQARSSRLLVLAVVLVACTGGLGAALLAWGSGPVMESLAWYGLALHFLLTVWAAFQSSYLFAEARSSGTLEQLLGTPLRPDQILDGYFLGLETVFRRPIILLLSVEGAIVLGEVVLVAQGQNSLTGAPLLVGAVLCMVLLVTDLFAVGRFGMWMGFISKKPAQAFLKTLLYVMVLPLFFLLCCSLLAPLIWLAKDSIFMNYGREQLRKHFRSALTEGRAPKAKPGTLPSVLE